MASLTSAACEVREKTREERAAQLYFRSCAGCHGQRGEGVARPGFKVPPAKLSDPSLATLSDEQLRQVIREGKGQMPSFGRLLSDEDVTLLIEHVRSLGPKPQTEAAR